ncbi:MAG: glycosyltransferase family 39 protein [Acidocella sp.]|nr:glycosyltransferase family 39 protein [Acidocella sp.]
MQRAMWAAFFVIMAATLVRLVFAATTGLGIDESYMVAASSHFAASYFDHPLASWWLELGSRHIFGGMGPLVVRLPFILLSILSSALLYSLTTRLYGGRAALWAIIAYNISPVFSLAFGCWVLPDGPLDAALLAFAYAICRALGIAEHPARPSSRWWWAAGVFAGLAMLSKYNAVLVLAGAAFVLMTDPVSRPALRRAAPWGAASLAIAMFSPVIAWNAAHGWQSFHYQGGRATGWHLHPAAMFTIWGGEALFVLPWLWLPMVVLMTAAIRRGPVDRRSWLLSLLAILPIVLFALIGTWSSTRILYHWATPGYLMLFPMLGAWLSGLSVWARRLMVWPAAILLAGAALAITAAVSTAALPDLDIIFAPGKSPMLQAIDWTSINTDIPPDTQAIAALRWYDAGKIGYAIRGHLPVTVFGADPHEFAISTPPASLLGKNILIIAMPGNIAAIGRDFAPDFKSLAPGPALVVAHEGRVLLMIPTFLGKDLIRVPAA